MQLYERFCPSVRPSVRLSRSSWIVQKRAFVMLRLWLCVFEQEKKASFGHYLEHNKSICRKRSSFNWMNWSILISLRFWPTFENGEERNIKTIRFMLICATAKEESDCLCFCALWKFFCHHEQYRRDGFVSIVVVQARDNGGNRKWKISRRCRQRDNLIR